LKEEEALLAMLKSVGPLLGPRAGASGFPSNGWLLEAATLCEKVDDHELGLSIVTALVHGDPQDPFAWVKLVDALEKSNRFDELEAMLASAAAAMESAPERARLRITVARVLIPRWIHTPMVIDLLSTALEEDPSDGDASDMLAEMLEHEGRFDEVATLLERRLELLGRDAPQFVDAAWKAGAALERSGRRDDAVRLYESMLARDEEGALERMTSAAVAAAAWDRVAEAGERLLSVVLKKGTEGQPGRLSQIAGAVADAHERLGTPGAAIESLERVLQLHPDNAELASKLEHVCEVKGDYERLSDLLASRAVHTHDEPAKMELLLRTGKLLLEKLHAPVRALPLIERARSLQPESVEAALALASAHRELGRADEALPALADVIARNRGKRPAGLADVYLEMGKLHLAADDLVEAFDALKAGLAIDSHSKELAILTGLVALDLDDSKTAERALMAVVLTRTDASNGEASAADRVTAYYHLAAIADTKGEEAKARRWIVQALSLDPTHQGVLALSAKFETQAPAASAARR